MTAATIAPEPPRRGPGRPRTGRVKVWWTLPPALAALVAERAAKQGVTESALVEQILTASRRLKAAPAP